MEPSFLTTITNLSIGALSVVSLVYVTVKFLENLEKMRAQHESAMMQREVSLRGVEAEVRQILREHIVQSNIALTENTKALAENAKWNERMVEELSRSRSQK